MSYATCHMDLCECSISTSCRPCGNLLVVPREKDFTILYLFWKKFRTQYLPHPKSIFDEMSIFGRLSMSSIQLCSFKHHLIILNFCLWEILFGQSSPYNFKVSKFTTEYMFIYGGKSNQKSLLPTLSKIVKSL